MAMNTVTHQESNPVNTSTPIANHSGASYGDLNHSSGTSSGTKVENRTEDQTAFGGNRTDTHGTSGGRASQSGDTEAFREGPVATAIENETAKIPSDVFMWAAGGAILTSLALQVAGSKHASNFIGQWAPTLLIIGVYNKIVKTQGHDRASRRA